MIKFILGEVIEKTFNFYKKYEICVCCVRKENPHDMITLKDIEYFSIIIYILETKNLI